MKARILSNLLLFSFLGINLVSCNLQSNTLPNAQGRQGEVVVVVNRALWEGAYGDSIRQYLAYPIISLPQPEPMFTLIQQTTLSDMMKKFRNIVMVNVEQGYETATLSYKENVWANGQLIFNISAPSADSAIACMDRNKDIIVSKFLLKDRDDYIAYFKKIVNEPVVKKIHEKFQVDIAVSKEYSLDVDKDNFMWLAREEGDRVMGLLMWKEPYTSQSQVETDRLIAKMNEMTKQNVSGAQPDSYMADEPTVPPVVRRFHKDNVYCVQMNGLWQMENSYMGGPYVNVSIVDEKRGQIVTGVGFVFYPRKDKRDYVRQLEAILYTMTPTAVTNE